MTSIAGTC